MGLYANPVENPLMPSMPGLDTTATNAAVAGNTNNMGTGSWTSSQNGTIFNSQTGAVQKPGFFGQGGMAQIGLGAISTLGSLWNSFQQNKIAKKSLALQERTFETNLANQTKTYNTELEDRIRTRYDTERRDPSEAQSYIEKNKL